MASHYARVDVPIAPGRPSALGAAPRGWSKAPSIRRTRGGLTPSNDDPLSHRLRPDDGREKGLMDGRLGLVRSFLRHAHVT